MPRYVVVATNDDDVILRPCVIDQSTERVVTVGCLNDWSRLADFAAELNEIDDE